MSSFTPPAPLAPLTKARSVDINNLTSAVATAFAGLPSDSDLNNGTVNYGVDSGTANTYIVTLPRTPTGYVDGLRVVFSPINSNTGASTINVNGLGVKNIRLQDNSAAEPGTLVAGIPKTLIYGAALGNFFVEANSVAAAAASAADAAASASAANASKVAAESAKNVTELYRDDAQSYASAADFSAAQAQSAVVAAGTSTIATSTSSVTIGNGTKTFTVQANKQFAVSQPLVAANGANKMFGSVVSYSGSTLVIDVTITEGAGTFSSWTIAPSGAQGPTGNLSGGNLTGALNENRAAGVDLSLAGGVPEVWAVTGNYIRTFNTGVITGFTTAPQQGAARTLLIGDQASITSSANMLVRGVPSATTVPLAPGDELDVRAETTTTFRVTINRGNGAAVAGPLYLKLSDRRASGVSGGASVSSDITQTRTINTTDVNTITGASLSGNLITLPPGTYRYWLRAPATNTGSAKAFLYNTTDGAYTGVGASIRVPGAGGLITIDCWVSGQFTLTDQKVFSVRHFTGGSATDGLGSSVGVAGQPEVYTEIEFEKVL